MADGRGRGGRGRLGRLGAAGPGPPARGGPQAAAESDPGLLPALEALVADSVRGDPQSPLTWTTRSVKKLAGELAAAGHPCGAVTVWRTLRRAGYTLQSNSRAAEGRQHPERDAQFRYIAAQAREHLAAGQPVISVDAKKREKIGNYGQDGREWRPQGSPEVVRSHDFPDKDGRHAVPYGIYDQAANAGFVNVGTDGNTAALAVESVRRWWRLAGKDAYPQATRLLVTCDAGGSNGHRNRAWKAGLAELARETGLDITVCHFPPGTSKWNKIEHRLFCQVTLAWRGRPLTSYDVIIDTIGNVTTGTGLTCAAVLDENDYPTGLKVTGQQMKQVEDRQLTRHEFHGEWNYTLLAAPRPAAPAPDPARPRPPGSCAPAPSATPPSPAPARRPSPRSPPPSPAASTPASTTTSASAAAPAPTPPAGPAAPAASAPPTTSSPPSSNATSASPPTSPPPSSASTRPPSATPSASSPPSSATPGPPSRHPADRPPKNASAPSPNCATTPPATASPSPFPPKPTRPQPPR